MLKGNGNGKWCDIMPLKNGSASDNMPMEM